MKSSVNKFSKGLISDLSQINEPNQSYKDSMGGNLIYNDNGNYDWVVSDGNSFSFNILPNGGATTNKYTPIGGVGNSNIKVIFSVDEINGFSEIGIFAVDSSGVGSYKTLYNDLSDPLQIAPPVPLLNFIATNQIEARFLYENDDLIRVYWVDGVESDSNRPRVFTFEYDGVGDKDNVTSYSPVTLSSHSINIQAEHTPGIIKYSRRISGNIPVGVYQYSYRLITVDGYPSPWTTPTRRLFVTSDEVQPSEWNKYEMEVSGISTAKGNRLQIKGIDQKYELIEVAYIYSQTDLQVDETTIFFKGTISGDTMIVNHSSMTGEPLLAAEIAAQFQGLKAAKTLDVKDSLMYFGNIVENLSLITDLESEAIVAALSIKPIFKDMRSDEQNYDSISSPVLTNQVPKTGTTNVQLHSGAGGTESYEISTDYVNYKGTQVDHLYSAHWRGETYRYALQLFDVLGFPVFAIHLGDFKFPEQTGKDYEFTRLKADGTTVTVNGSLAEYPWPTNNYNDASLLSPKVWAEDPNPSQNIINGISYLRIMGIEFSGIDLSAILDRVSGFSIVRTDLDATILSQGMLLPTVADLDSGKPISRPLPGVTQRWYDGAGGTVNLLNPNTLASDVQIFDPNDSSGNPFSLRPNLSTFYAPDYDFDSSYVPVPQSQDKLRLVGGCFSRPNSTKITPGIDPLAAAWFTYNVGNTNTNTNRNVGGLHSITKYYFSKNDYHFTSGSASPFPNYLNEASVLDSISVPLGGVITEYTPGIDLHNSAHFQDGTAQGYNGGDVVGSGKSATYYVHGNFEPRNASGTAVNWSPLYNQNYPLFPGAYTLGSFIANYVRVNLSPYGGVTQSSLEQSIFYSTGHFQPLNNETVFPAPANDLYNGIQVFGGDCYLDYFAFLRTYPKYDGATREVADGCVFPLESTLNHTLRQAPSVGDPQYAQVGALPKDQFNGNLNTNFSNGLFSDAASGTSFLEEFNLNAAMLQREQLKFFFAKPVGFSDNNKYPVRWRYTQSKFYGEEKDSWRRFLANEYDDLNGTYGEITSSSYLFNQIYSFQESAFGRLRAFDRAVLDSSTGALTTGVGGKLDGIDYISTKFGNQHQFSMTNSGKAVYWLDVDKRKAVRFAGDGKQSISDIRGLHGFFKNELGNYYNQDSPAGGAGISVGYDFSNNHVFWTFVRDYYRNTGTNVLVNSEVLNSSDYYANNETIFIDWTGATAVNSGIFFPETEYTGVENRAVVYYVSNKAGANSVHLMTASTTGTASIGIVGPGENWEVTRDGYTGVWSAVIVTLADITAFKATICYNEDLDSFMGFFPFRPTYYISHKDTILTHDRSFPNIENKMYIHGLNPNKANYYGQDYKSYISISSHDDEFFAKIFDTVRVNFNEQGYEDISRFIFGTEGQNYYYDVPTDTRQKYLEDSLRMPIRTFNQKDRARGKWINYIFEYKNNSATPVKLFNLITNYRISNRK